MLYLPQNTCSRPKQCQHSRAAVSYTNYIVSSDFLECLVNQCLVGNKDFDKLGPISVFIIPKELLGLMNDINAENASFIL